MVPTKPSSMWEPRLPILGRILILIDTNRSLLYDRLAEVIQGEVHFMAGPVEVYITPPKTLRMEGPTQGDRSHDDDGHERQ